MSSITGTGWRAVPARGGQRLAAAARPEVGLGETMAWYRERGWINRGGEGPRNISNARSSRGHDLARPVIFEQLAALLQTVQPRRGRKSTLRTDIAADLNIDSVAVMDFVMEVEDHFDIEIPLNVLSEIRTMDELVSVVEKRSKRSEVA